MAQKMMDVAIFRTSGQPYLTQVKDVVAQRMIRKGEAITLAEYRKRQEAAEAARTDERGEPAETENKDKDKDKDRPPRLRV